MARAAVSVRVDTTAKMVNAWKNASRNVTAKTAALTAAVESVVHAPAIRYAIKMASAYATNNVAIWNVVLTPHAARAVVNAKVVIPATAVPARKTASQSATARVADPLPTVAAAPVAAA